MRFWVRDYSDKIEETERSLDEAEKHLRDVRRRIDRKDTWDEFDEAQSRGIRPKHPVEVRAKAEDHYEKVRKKLEKLYSKQYGLLVDMFGEDSPEVRYFEKRRQKISSHSPSYHSGLERTAVTASIVGVFGGLFFTTQRINGFAINNLTTNETTSGFFGIDHVTSIGAILLVIGVVGLCALFRFRNRRKR